MGERGREKGLGGRESLQAMLTIRYTIGCTVDTGSAKREEANRWAAGQ